MANRHGQVANAVTEEAAKLKDISKDPPKADSQLVKGWQEKFHPQVSGGASSGRHRQNPSRGKLWWSKFFVLDR